MYTFLPNELADVDLAEFEEVGSFYPTARQDPTVIAVPEHHLALGLKGIRSSGHELVEECQNTFFLTYEPLHDIEAELIQNPFQPGKIYRRDGRDYVELLYKHGLGALTVYVYFLVDAEHCTFAHFNEGHELSQIRYSNLWKNGFVKVKS